MVQSLVITITVLDSMQPQNPQQSPQPYPQQPAPVTPSVPIQQPQREVPPTYQPQQQPTVQQPQPQFTPLQAFGSNPGGTYTPPNKRLGSRLLKAFLLLLGVTVLSGIAYVFYYALVIVPEKSTLSVADLTEASSDSTSFKYPKQWESIDSSTYGDGFGKADGTHTALISVKKTGFQQGNITEQPSESLDQLRSAILNSSDDESIKDTISSGGQCNSPDNIQKESYKHTNDNSVGLVKLSAECTKDDVVFKLVTVTVIGDDGYVRAGQVVALKEYWAKNATVYNAMLDSVKQKD